MTPSRRMLATADKSITINVVSNGKVGYHKVYPWARNGFVAHRRLRDIKELTDSANARPSSDISPNAQAPI